MIEKLTLGGPAPPNVPECNWSRDHERLLQRKISSRFSHSDGTATRAVVSATRRNMPLNAWSMERYVRITTLLLQISGRSSYFISPRQLRFLFSGVEQ